MLIKIIKHDLQRYKSKGIWLAVAFLSFISFFIYFPKIASQLLIPLMNKYFNDDMYFLIFLHNFTYISFSLLLFICYHFDLLRKYKANKNPWPWEENIEEWRDLFKKSLKLLFLNMFIIGPILVIISKGALKLNYKMDIENIPSPINFSLQLLICFLANDFMFHFSHKLLHLNFLYKWIHSVHHQYNNVIGISAEYAHPIEYIIGNVLPTTVGPLLLHMLNFPNFHIVTIWGFTILGIGATIEQHSGYDFPFSPYGIFPFTFASSYHDYHHTRAKGNYSSNFVYLDLIFGNNHEYYNLQEKFK